jgi:hypothetical protein
MDAVSHSFRFHIDFNEQGLSVKKVLAPKRRNHSQHPRKMASPPFQGTTHKLQRIGRAPFGRFLVKLELKV